MGGKVDFLTMLVLIKGQFTLFGFGENTEPAPIYFRIGVMTQQVAIVFTNK
jgi:hypothetical protein